MNERIEAALASMTLPDKIRLLSGAEMFRLHGNDRIGLEPIVLSDGPTGVRGDVVVGGRVGCLLPNASLLAQSWNPELLTEVGDLLAEEAMDQKTHVVLGPTINLHRSPLGGRLFESFSEDPLLTGLLAVAYVKGLQARGIAATPKHFLGNESETQRTTVNAVIDPVALREAYLAPFEIVVEDAEPWALMAAYNRVNGVPSTEQDELVNGIVKGEWGFDGVMVSDWLATQSTVQSANGGLDLVMPGPDTPWTESLEDEVLAGRVAETTVDDHVRRLLRLAWRVGAVPAGSRNWATGLPRPDSTRRREQLRRLAAESMVVLKNDNAALPLRREQTVALIGRHATDTIAQGGGSAQVRPPHVVSVAEGMAAYFDAERLRVVDGVETRVVLPAASPDRLRDPETGEPGIRARVYGADGALLASRHLDLAELEDSQAGWLADAAVIELEGAVQLPHPARMKLGVRGPGRWTVTAPGYEERVEIGYHHGPGGGFFRPKSHATTIELEPGAIVRARVVRGELPRILGLVLTDATRPSAMAISDAVRAAQDADVAVLVVGFTPDQETEGQDKVSLRIPGDQDALVAAVATSARHTVVVVNAATPILMPWIDLVDAVVFAGLPGQEAGHAITAALTGEILPEGRLVTTFPASDGAGPAWSVTPTDGDLVYTESAAVGYRGWYDSGQEPAFWFGHGLGYTDWAYEDARIVPGTPQHPVNRVSVRLRNVGGRAGKETIQIYARPRDPQHPVRLIGWAQATIGPGETRMVEVVCDARMQRCWDTETGAWQPLSDLDVLIARGLGDVRATISVEDLSHDSRGWEARE
jgi:beta-glucosidase